MNFGNWIVVSFVAFAIFIATLVTICVRQDIPLVSKDYYKEEIAYQEQIVRMENTNQLTEKPNIFFEDSSLTVEYKGLPRIESGQLKLFRPSDDRLDEQFNLAAVESSRESFVIKNAVRGMYRVKMTWQQDGKGYFFEKVIVL